MSTASEMTLAAETMMATAASTTNAMAAVAAAHAAHNASKSSPAAKLGFSIDSIVGGGSQETKEKAEHHSHIASALAEASRLRDSLTVADFSLALAARNGAADNAAAAASAAAAAAAAIHRPFNSSPNSPRSRH